MIWDRFPTDEMSLRGLIEACSANEETGRTHLHDYLDMTARVKSVTNEATGETFPDIDAAQEAVSVYDQDGPPVFFVEYEPGRAPHSENTVIISLAEDILRLRDALRKTVGDLLTEAGAPNTDEAVEAETKKLLAGLERPE